MIYIEDLTSDYFFSFLFKIVAQIKTINLIKIYLHNLH
jgi:hypothetical protein